MANDVFPTLLDMLQSTDGVLTTCPHLCDTLMQCVRVLCWEDTARLTIVRANIMPHIVRIMLHHVSDCNVQTAGCGAISALASCAEEGANGPQQVVAAGAVPVVTAAIVAFPYNVPLQHLAIGALLNTAWYDDENRVTVLGDNMSTVPIVMASLARWIVAPESPNIKEVSEMCSKACSLLTRLTRIAGDTGQAVSSMIVSICSIDMLVTALDSPLCLSSDDATRQLVLLLSRMSRHELTYRDMMIAAGIVSALLRVLTRFPRNAELFADACAIFGAVTFDALTNTSIQSVEGYDSVLTVVLKSFTEPAYCRNLNAIAQALHVLRNLAGGDDARKMLVEKHGGLVAALSKMRQPESVLDVTRAGCMVVYNLCCTSNVDILWSLVHLQGIEVLLTAMRNHARDVNITLYATFVIRAVFAQVRNCTLLHDNDSTLSIQRRLINADGVRVLLESAANHVERADIQLRIATIIMCMVTPWGRGNVVDDDVVDEVVSAGALQVITAMIIRWPDNAKLQETCVVASSAMVMHDSSDEKDSVSACSLAASGLLSAVALAVRRYGTTTANNNACSEIDVNVVQGDAIKMFHTLMTRVLNNAQSVEAIVNSGVVDMCLHIISNGHSYRQYNACDMLNLLTEVSERVRRELSLSHAGMCALIALMRSSPAHICTTAMWTLLNSTLTPPADASDKNDMIMCTMGTVERRELLRNGFASAMRSNAVTVRAAVGRLKCARLSNMWMQALWALRVTFDDTDAEKQSLAAVADVLVETDAVNVLLSMLEVMTGPNASEVVMRCGATMTDGESTITVLARETMLVLQCVVVRCATAGSRLEINVGENIRRHSMRGVVQNTITVLANDAELVAAGESILCKIDSDHHVSEDILSSQDAE
jgi:hypothetical protein